MEIIRNLDGVQKPIRRSPKCAGVRTRNTNGEDFACGYATTIVCDDCKYGAGGGRKDPQAKCNQPKEK